MLEIKTVTNGPIAKYVQCVCYDTLSWLISFSLGGPNCECACVA